MTLTKDERVKLITGYRLHEKDSGSPEVQIALLTAEIDRLTQHMQRHSKDYHSRQGLLKMVNRRNKLLAYLNRNQRERYVGICQRLNLRR